MRCVRGGLQVRRGNGALTGRAGTMKGPRSILAVAVAAVLLAAGGYLLLREGDPRGNDAGIAGAEKADGRDTARRGWSGERRRRDPGRRKAGLSKTARAPQGECSRVKPELDIDDEGLSAEERKLRDAIERSLDDEDLAAARALAARAMASTNTEIRQMMVDTLGWFGMKALPELTPFLADSDEDVRSSAVGEWSSAVSDIDDDAEKLGVVELAMHVLTDEDALEDISTEYIGTDEKLAVESLLRIIEAGGSSKGIEKAKETYEFVTGEEFTSRADAEKWIAEEYEEANKGGGSE